MCIDICTINIRVSIRVRGLHLVFFTSQGGKGFGGKAAPGGKAPGGKAAHGGKAHGGKAPPTQGTGQFGGHADANKNTLICWSKSSQFLSTKILITHWNSFKKNCWLMIVGCGHDRI